jgi:ligand-binding SRPBCC domain-containing protein
MRFSYRTEQWVPYPIQVVFDFFADPTNLPLLMPPWQQVRIERMDVVPPPARLDRTTASATGIAGPGSQITLSFRPLPYLPIRRRWEAQIEDFAWDDRFFDRQTRGPFVYWNHCHRMRSMMRHDIALTLLTDEVEYELPGGKVGQLAHSLFLRRQIRHAFTFRHRQLESILAGRVKSPPSPPQSA